MRFVEYETFLREGYAISSDYDIYASTAHGSVLEYVRRSSIHMNEYTLERIQRPGIRMTIEYCDDPTKFCGAFEYCRTENVWPKFERQIPQVLRGDETSWKLDRVWLYMGQLYLGYTNAELYKKYLACRKAQVYPYKFFAESAFIGRQLNIWHEIDTKLRFEVHNPNDDSTTVTIITFGPHQPITITEFDGNKKRCLTFLEPSFDMGDRYHVTEWMQ